MTGIKCNNHRDQRIRKKAVVDANGPEERAMGLYHYLDCKYVFPFTVRCTAHRPISPRLEEDEMEMNSMAKKRGADLLRISIGIGLILSFFLPMGIYYYHDGDTSFHPFYGFLVTTSYLGVVIGVIMIFYYKLPFFRDFPLPKFLYKATILILAFDWIVNILILDGGILVDYWHHIMWGEGSDISVEFYNGSIFFMITSFVLFSLRLYHTKRETSVLPILLFSLFLFFIGLVFRFLLFIQYYP